MSQFPINVADIRAAADRLSSVIRPTPLLHSPTYSAETGCDVYLKAENLQVTGSFKIRGAYNKISLLTAEQKARGVVAASMGNHAQGVALAASLQGVKATIVMPVVASLSKYQATRGYGAEVILHGDTVEECVVEACRIERETGAVFIHPYDDWEIMAGQGTLGLEIMEQLPEADGLIVPLGGGGLLSGVALAAKAIKPEIRIVGVQAAGCAPFPLALASDDPVLLDSGVTIADGIRVRRPGDRTLSVVRGLVDEVVTVDDEAISRTIVQLLEQRKLVVEGAGAASVAALTYGACAFGAGAKVVSVLGGGNIDVTLIGRLIDYGLAVSGRLLMVEIKMIDVPNELLRFLGIMAGFGANITQIAHYRGEMNIPVGHVKVLLRLETRDAEQQEAILAAMEDHGYAPVRLGPDESESSGLRRHGGV